MENNQKHLEEKFKDVPSDKGTAIIQSHFGKIGIYDVKFEFWAYSSFAGVSAIFLKEDIQHLSDQEISEMVKEECETPKVEIGASGEKFLFATYGVKDHSDDFSYF